MAYSAIIKPSDYFDTKLYTGTGSSNAQTGLGFQPDMVWLKNRGATSNHFLNDVLRGITKELRPNLSNSQADDNQLLTSLNSDGFTLGTSGSANTNGNTYVAWNWKANGAGSSNTNGSINTLYTSANTTSGFSISTYIGVGDVGSRTFGHGLTKAPEIVMIKNLTANENWVVGTNYTHPTLPWKYKLTLDNNNARAESGAYFADTAPTNSLVTIEGNAGVNGSGNTLVAYCFHSVTGFSKMGSYVGNGNADGTFVYTGFKPAWILMKDIGRAESWYIYDGKILGYNGQMGDFLANTTASVGTNYAIQVDMLSNGFKLNTTASHLNGSGENFIYMAFAESPFVSNVGESLPTTAR